MASLGRLTFAGISGVNENTIALASINFDFSLVKIDPPKEFKDLGNSLSDSRKKEAEEGSIHRTARKLGAIFEPILPSTPEVLRAYGKRASEVAKSSASSSTKDPGFFTKQAGVDGTSIWAAATSGNGALQVHLLACMLARIWEQKEAISIWAEILESRKREIENAFEREGTMNIATCGSYLAALREITRPQLATWDDSARAWLRIADRDKTIIVRQNQLDQITGRIKKIVNTKPSLYDSVIQAWQAALDGTEKLLKGLPQQMQSGELLLGLNAWHIYPDLNLLDETSVLAEFKDPLVPRSGILTIGLQMSDSAFSKGLHWSLPLGHLRYYGDPISRTGRLSGVRSRVSMSEFMQAILGCVLGGWGVEDGKIDVVLKWITMLNDRIFDSHALDTVVLDKTWITLLSEAALAFLASTSEEKMLYRRLFNAGKTYGSKRFLGQPSRPYFGLSRTQLFLRLHNEQEDRIDLLRRLAIRSGAPKNDIIIRYFSSITGKEEYASVYPRTQISGKRTRDGKQRVSASHTRWVHTLPYRDRNFPRDEDASSPVQHIIGKDAFMGNKSPKEKEYWKNHAETESVQSQNDAHIHALEQYHAQEKRFANLGEVVQSIEAEPLTDLGKRRGRYRIAWGELDVGVGLNEWLWDPLYGDVKHFELFYGDPEDAALFLRMGVPNPALPDVIEFHALFSLFSSEKFNESLFLEILDEAINSLGDSYLDSLRAIATIHQVYQQAPCSTLAIKLLEIDQPLSKASWVNHCILNARKSSQEDRLDKDDNRAASVASLGMDKDEDEDIEWDQVVSVGSPRGSEGFFEEAVESMMPKSDVSRKAQKPALEHIAATASKRLLSPFDLDLESTFSCVLLCESGLFDISPDQLVNIMAISSGNSLFIASPLLSDPSRALAQSPKVEHVMGNIGRAGIALLQPPTAPRIKAIGIEQWNFITNENWDGHMRDTFRDTSLHLWFTGSTLSLDNRYSKLGEKDTELYMIESVISVHGRGTHGPGEWIADLDVLKALRDPLMILDPTPLVASGAEVLNKQGDLCPIHGQSNYERTGLKLKALENWMETLETPSESSIFLATGNWQARLAATSICISQGHTVFVLGNPACWECVFIKIMSLDNLSQKIVYIG